MSLIPQHMLKKRQKISEKYLIGQGLEVGALHNPLWVSKKASVKYVDRLSIEELRLQYPELNDLELVKIDIIDNGEKLTKVQDNSLDFVIGNHMLEHCENPLGTIRSHLSKLINGGILYYAVPNKKHSFDIDRPITSFEHLVKDDQQGSEFSRYQHFHEWVTLVNKASDEKIEAQIKQLLQINYSIHFHVWDEIAFQEFLLKAQTYLKHFKILHFEQNDMEMITVLKKTV